MSMTTEAMSAVFRALIILTLGLGSYLGAWIMFDVKNYNHLRTVEVEPVFAGTMPMVDVGRTIHRPFFGGYEVTIRDALSAHIVCATGEVDVPYKPESRPLRKSLAWWASGGSCDAALEDGLLPGRYSMVTCHYVRNPWIILPQKARCVGPTEFRIYAKNEPLPEPLQRPLENLESRIDQIGADG